MQQEVEQELEKVDLIEIKNFDELFKLFGVSHFNHLENTFQFQGQQFRLKTEEIFQNLQDIKANNKIKPPLSPLEKLVLQPKSLKSVDNNQDQSGQIAQNYNWRNFNQISSEKYEENQQQKIDLKQSFAIIEQYTNNLQVDNIKKTITPRVGSLMEIHDGSNYGKIGTFCPDINKSMISSKVQNIKLKSPLNLQSNSRSQNTLKIPKSVINNNINVESKEAYQSYNKFDLNTFQDLSQNSQMIHSNISNKSGISDVKLSQQESILKSPHIISHELKALRLRSHSKNKQNPLQMEKQNLTDKTINYLMLPHTGVGRHKTEKQSFNYQLQDRQNQNHYLQVNNELKEQVGKRVCTINSQLNESNSYLQKQFQQNHQHSQHSLYRKKSNPLQHFQENFNINQQDGNCSRLQDQKELIDQHSYYQEQQIEKQREYIHLAFLFASPLMLKISDKIYDTLAPISFAEEFEQIRQSIEAKKIQFNYKYSVSTPKNLLNALRENPIGLHFSGHGFINNEHLYKDDKKSWLKYKSKGDVLIFENESGASEFFFSSDLKKMFEDVKKQLQNLDDQVLEQNFDKTLQENIQPQDNSLEEPTKSRIEEKETELQFVCVASCHSEQVGTIFLEAGVLHVVCIDQKETIQDKAAIEFSKFFYDEVFDQYNNICDAYTYAKEKVEVKFGKFEAGKIKLLKNLQKHGENCSRQKNERLKPMRGIMQQIGAQQDILCLPNKVTPFISRNKDMYDVLQLITQYNIVQIYGMPGLGKSSLLKNVTCYLGERNIYSEGILYLDFLHVLTFKEVVETIYIYLRNEQEIQNEIFFHSFNQDNFLQEVEKLKNKIAAMQHRFLFAFDNIDHLQKDNHEKFLKFIHDIASQQIKIIFTSGKYKVDSSESFVVKKIQKLRKEDSVDLFMKKIPLSDDDKQQFLEYSNIIKLHQITLEKYGKDSVFVIPDLCKLKHSAHTQICVINYLKEHPIFEFLAGIPLVISIVAPLSVMKSIGEIFLYLADKNKHNFQEEILQNKISDESLINCLEYCTQHFKNLQKSYLLELWYMIGIQGPGILYEDLKAIYCSSQGENEEEQRFFQPNVEFGPEENDVKSEQMLDKNLQELITLSLIEQELQNKSGTIKRYRASPFVDQYIRCKIDKNMKKDLMNVVCTHLKTTLIEFKKSYATDIIKSQTIEEAEKVYSQLQEKIKPYEQQIMHLVNECINMNEDDTQSDLDDDSSDENIERGVIARPQNDQLLQVGAQSQSTKDKEHQSFLSHQSKHRRIVSKGGASSTAKKQFNNEVHPKVSDHIRYARSTFVQRKNPSGHQDQQLNFSNCQQQMNSYQIDQHQISSLNVSKNYNQKTNDEKNLLGKSSPQAQKNLFKSLIQDELIENSINDGPVQYRPRMLSDNPNNIQNIISQSGNTGILFKDSQHNSFPEQEGIQGQVNIQSETSKHLKKNIVAQKKRNYQGLSEISDNFISMNPHLAKYKDSSIFNLEQKKPEEQQDSSDCELETDEQDFKRMNSFLFDRYKSSAERKNVNQNNQKLSQSDQDNKNSATLQLIEIQISKVDQNDNQKLLRSNSKNLEAENSYSDQNDVKYKKYEDSKDDFQEEYIQINEKQEMNSSKRRSKYLKQLESVIYDTYNSAVIRKRQSTLRQSSKDFLLASHKFNPDIQFINNSAIIEVQESSEDVWDDKNFKDKETKSAPPKQLSKNCKTDSQIVSALTHQEENKNNQKIKLLVLDTHEELFYHYLSILAILPGRRADLLEILDTHGQRNIKSRDKTLAGQKPTVLDLVSQGERRLKQYETIVDIPGESKLLRANTMMLELYVIIQESQFSLSRQDHINKVQKHLRSVYDQIHEKAHEMRCVFEEIQFQRGLAMIDYVQAERQLKKFGRIQAFKDLLLQSALKFEETHEKEGVQQCLSLAKKWIISIDNQNNLQIKKHTGENDKYLQDSLKQTQQNLEYLKKLEECLQRLDNSNEQTQMYINFRKEVRLNNLSAVFNIKNQNNTNDDIHNQSQQKIQIDLVYNMLLNPQYQLQIIQQE